MKRSSDLDSFEDLEAALSALYHSPRPNPAFTEKLERRLIALGPAEPERLPWRRRLGRFFAAASPSLAWGALTVLLVAGLIWSINHLLPAGLPGPLQGTSATPTPFATPESTTAELTPADLTPAANTSLLSLASSHQEIRERLTQPRWSSVWIQGWAARPLESGGTEKMFVQAWLEKDGAGRVTSTGWLPGDTAFSLELSPEAVWVVSNPRGQLWKLDVGTGETTSDPDSGNSVLHPLEGLNPVLETIFLPRQLVILSSDVNPVGEEEIAGRPVLVVEWGGSRLWADAETGLVLKRQTRDGVTPEFEVNVDQVVYGVKAPEVVFSPDGLVGARFELAPGAEGEAETPAPPAASDGEPRITVIAGVDAVNVRSGPGTEAFPVIGTLTAGATAPAVGRSPGGEWIQILFPEGPDGLGWVYSYYLELAGGELPVVEPPPTATPQPVLNMESDPIHLTFGGGVVPGASGNGGLYFVLQTWDDGFTYRFFGVELPCLLSELRCKAVAIPEFQQENYTSFADGLTWAPDGKKAVVLDSNNQQLHLYRAGKAEWQTIAYQIFISGGTVRWSPDGTYLSGTTQGEDGLSNLVTVIPADGEGEEPSWRVYGDDLGGDQTVVGWADDQTVLFIRSWTPPKGATGEAEPPRLYRLNVISGEWDELDFDLGWNKGFPALSPDGSTLILNMESDWQAGLWSIDLDSGEAVFLGVNGDYVTWSPDGQQIAFSAYENGQPSAYVINSDGGELRKVFEWNSPFTIDWSPDGEHLLLQIWPTDTERTIFFLVSVPDGLVRRIELDVSGVNSEPRYPSFQPGSGR